MHMPILKVILLGILIAEIVTAQAHWNRFRGPEGSGIAAVGQALPVLFGPEKNVLWTRAVPVGHSSPCIWGDRIFLTGNDGEKLCTLCIDRKTGELVWRRDVEVRKLERAHRINSASSPTPTTDGERVYVYFGSFGVLCYDFAGDEKWRRKLAPERNMFGTATSPILAGKYLILSRDSNKNSYLEAIDPKTGKTVWKKDRSGFQAGWSTPILWHHDGIDELIVYGAFRLMGYDLRDGTERWTVPGLADEPCITPVTGDGIVFVTSYNMRTNPEVIGLPKFAELLEKYDSDKNGRLNREEVKDNKSILSRVDADGEGDHPLRGFFRFLDRDRDGELTAGEWQKMFDWLNTFKHRNALVAVRPGDGKERDPEIVWQHSRGVPECPSPLYFEGRIYLVKNGGIASCIDAKTGKAYYQKRLGSRGPCYSSPVVGDGKIYIASAQGVVTVYKVGDDLEVLARNDLKERIMATPALVDGRVYVRTAKSLYAFGADQ